MPLSQQGGSTNVTIHSESEFLQLLQAAIHVFINPTNIASPPEHAFAYLWEL